MDEDESKKGADASYGAALAAKTVAQFNEEQRLVMQNIEAARKGGAEIEGQPDAAPAESESAPAKSNVIKVDFGREHSGPTGS